MATAGNLNIRDSSALETDRLHWVEITTSFAIIGHYLIKCSEYFYIPAGNHNPSEGTTEAVSQSRGDPWKTGTLERPRTPQNTERWDSPSIILNVFSAWLVVQHGMGKLLRVINWKGCEQKRWLPNVPALTQTFDQGTKDKALEHNSRPREGKKHASNGTRSLSRSYVMDWPST